MSMSIIIMDNSKKKSENTTGLHLKSLTYSVIIIGYQLEKPKIIYFKQNHSYGGNGQHFDN